MKPHISATAYRLPLRHPFTISRYTVEVQETVIVSISYGDYIGYGEATANPYYGSTTDKIIASVKSVSRYVQEGFESTPQKLWEKISTLLEEDYFALCAIDCAFWDLRAKQEHLPLRDVLRDELTSVKQNQSSLYTSYTVGLASLEQMKAKIKEKPWPVYKIKLGTQNDLDIITSLSLSTKSAFRVDANCAWTADQTLAMAKEMKQLDVEFIEQPLPHDEIDAMANIKKECVLPLMADESCQRYKDVAKCAKGFHAINIKLMKCGGLTPAIRMIHKARELGLNIMLGCMTESGVGIANVCQLALWVDYLDTDGAMLLKNDLAQGVHFEKGELIYSDKSGNGIHTFKP